MRRYVQDLQLSPRWWWGMVGVLLFVTVIFLAAGATAPAAVCLAFAAAVAALALASRSGD